MGHCPNRIAPRLKRARLCVPSPAGAGEGARRAVEGSGDENQSGDRGEVLGVFDVQCSPRGETIRGRPSCPSPRPQERERVARQRRVRGIVANANP